MRLAPVREVISWARTSAPPTPRRGLTGWGSDRALRVRPYFANDIPVYDRPRGCPPPSSSPISSSTASPACPRRGRRWGTGLDIEVAMNMARAPSSRCMRGTTPTTSSTGWPRTTGRSRSAVPGFPPAPRDGHHLSADGRPGTILFDAAGTGGLHRQLDDLRPHRRPVHHSVGGTSLTTSGPSGPWLSETTWSGSGAA